MLINGHAGRRAVDGRWFRMIVRFGYLPLEPWRIERRDWVDLSRSAQCDLRLLPESPLFYPRFGRRSLWISYGVFRQVLDPASGVAGCLKNERPQGPL